MEQCKRYNFQRKATKQYSVISPSQYSSDLAHLIKSLSNTYVYLYGSKLCVLRTGWSILKVNMICDPLHSNPNFDPYPVLLWPPRRFKEPQPWRIQCAKLSFQGAGVRGVSQLGHWRHRAGSVGVEDIPILNNTIQYRVENAKFVDQTAANPLA